MLSLDSLIDQLKEAKKSGVSGDTPMFLWVNGDRIAADMVDHSTDWTWIDINAEAQPKELVPYHVKFGSNMCYVHCLKCDHVYPEHDMCPQCGNNDKQQTVFLCPESKMNNEAFHLARKKKEFNGGLG